MFNFIVYQAGELFGRPEVHAILMSDVNYTVMFATDGTVWSTVS